MKRNLLLFTILVLLVGCVTPSRVTTTYMTDSTGKQVKVVNKFYSNIPTPSLNVVTTPFWYNNMLYPYYSPRIIVPMRITPHYVPRGRRR